MDDMTGSGWVTLGGPAAGSGPSQWDEPSGIAISPPGKILVSDENNGRIVEMDDLTGAGWQEWRVPHWGATSASPYGVAYDDQSRIYAVEFGDLRRCQSYVCPGG
jgi:streptogramin lyase